MKMYSKKLLTEINNKPQELLVGTCVFLVAIMATSVQHVASTLFAVLVITSFFVIKDWSVIWKSLSKNEKYLLCGFALYAASGLIAFINVEDVHGYFKVLERYMRFLIAIPVYLYVKKYNIDMMKYLFTGAVVSGPFLLLVAYLSYLNEPDMPASGYYHHIIFAAVGMLNAGVMLAKLLTVRMTFLNRVIVIISIVCGTTAVVLSQSRGVWLVAPLYLFIAIYFSIKYSKMTLIGVALAIIVIFGSFMLSPLGNMIESRVDSAVGEIAGFYEQDQNHTSVGARLAMWEISIYAWKKHPIVGTGPADFDQAINSLQKNGKYIGVPLFESVHNIYLQALVNGGLIGAIAMLFALFYMPLKILKDSAKYEKTSSLTGIFIVLTFAIIGFSESWTLRLPMVSVYIVYIIAVISSIHTQSNIHLK